MELKKFRHMSNYPWKKRGKEKSSKKKRGKDNIPLLLYTESEGKKRKIKTKKEEIGLKEVVSHA